MSAIPHIPFETRAEKKKETSSNNGCLPSTILHYILSLYLSTTCPHSNTVSSKTHVSILSNTVLTILSVLSVISSSLLFLSCSHTDLPTFTHLDPLVSLYKTELSLSVPRPCCVSICFPRAPGGITSCLRRINGFRHFCYFSTGFISFMKDFNSFLSRAAVLRFRLKFK